MWLVGLIVGFIAVGWALKYLILYLNGKRQAEIEANKKAAVLGTYEERLRVVLRKTDAEKIALKGAEKQGDARAADKIRRRIAALEKEAFALQTKMDQIFYK